MENPHEYIWEQKHRPRTLDECVLPSFTRETMKKIEESGQLNNMLFSSSSPGTGKTTLARVLAEDMNYSVLFVNASEDSGIDTVRTKIRQFASTLDLSGRAKLVIMDEADGFTESSQKALRGFIEEFSASCRFIFTANHPNKIIEPIRSRLTQYEFTIPESERQDIMKQMIKRCLDICEREGVPVTSRRVIAELVKKHFPDNRQVIIELQNYSRHGEIDEGILGHVTGNSVTDEIITGLKQRDFKSLRQLAVTAADNYSGTIQELYKKGFPHVDNKSKGDFILYLAENMKYERQVADLEIHLAALFVELMTEIQWQ